MVNTVEPIKLVELKWTKEEMVSKVKQSFSEKEVEFMTNLVQEGFNIEYSLYYTGDDVGGFGVMSESENMLVPMFKDGFRLAGFLLEKENNSIIAYYADEKDQEKFYKLDLDLKRVFEFLGFKSNDVKLRTDVNVANGLIIVEINFKTESFIFDYVPYDEKYENYTLIDDGLEKLISDELVKLNFRMLN